MEWLALNCATELGKGTHSWTMKRPDANRKTGLKTNPTFWTVLSPHF